MPSRERKAFTSTQKRLETSYRLGTLFQPISLAPVDIQRQKVHHRGGKHLQSSLVRLMCEYERSSARNQGVCQNEDTAEVGS